MIRNRLCQTSICQRLPKVVFQQLWNRLWRRIQFWTVLNQQNILALVGIVVCDGDHWLDVMNNWEVLNQLWIQRGNVLVADDRVVRICPVDQPLFEGRPILIRNVMEGLTERA